MAVAWANNNTTHRVPGQRRRHASRTTLDAQQLLSLIEAVRDQLDGPLAHQGHDDCAQRRPFDLQHALPVAR
ncbi:hypothetical protein A5727_16940 [Mycobacterium sp. ACS4331]|nr:hypothetical protein A5727_16940 [Mycobacterium sp. ACS4331]